MDLDQLEQEGGALGKYMKAISQFYADFHKSTYNLNGLMLHDPTAFVAITNPELFWWKRGPIRVSCEGLLKGMTVMDENKKKWIGPNAWSDRKHMSVALEVDYRAVVTTIRSILLQK